MNIALVIHGLGPGGAERTMTTLANAWADRGNNVTLISFDDGTTPPAFALNPKIHHRALSLVGPSRNIVHAIIANLARVRRLRSVLRQENPDVAISFITATNVVTILATLRSRIPLIVSERVDPNAHRLTGTWATLRLILYRFADAVVVQGEQIVGALPPSIRPLAHVIPNPVTRPIDTINSATSANEIMPSDRHHVVGIGRLVPQKGFDILIRAFVTIAEQYPDWDLIIWGEGEERPALQSLILQLGLKKRVKLPGVTARPAAAFAAADLFVLSSRYEGFPNALAEAMACGLPVIATDCPSGPAEIIRENVDGVLVAPNDDKALAGAIGRLITNETLRCSLAARAPEITARFSVDDIVRRWNNLIAIVGHQS